MNPFFLLRKICFVISLILIQSSVFSQVDPRQALEDLPLRVEIPVQSSNETYRVIPCGKEGMILFYRSTELEGSSSINWYFAHYDTNLIRMWVKPVPIPVDHNFIMEKALGDTLVLLFAPVGKAREQDNTYEILRIAPKHRNLILNQGSIASPGIISDFTIQHRIAWLGINRKGMSGAIATLSLDKGSSNVFSPGVGGELSVLCLQADPYQPRVSAVVSRQVARKYSEYYLVEYDTTGRLLNETMMGTQTGSWSIGRAEIKLENSGKKLVLGTYFLGNQDARGTDKRIEMASGFFSCTVGSEKQQAVKFYNFLEFKNAEAFIGEKDIMELKKKALKKKKSLSEYSLDYELVVHDLQVVDDEILLTAEVYQPQYRSETFTDFDFYGRPFTNTYSVFDGYRYSIALVAGFDREGQLSWDNFIEYRNLLTPDLMRKVTVYLSSGNYVLSYLQEAKMASKIIHRDKPIEKTAFSPLELMYPEDKLVSEIKAKAEIWYDNYFLASGYQEVKNISRGTDNKRLVYYFTRLQFTP